MFLHHLCETVFGIIPDELNLASTDILEAPNQVLDVNRGMYIPETTQAIKSGRLHLSNLAKTDDCIQLI